MDMSLFELIQYTFLTIIFFIASMAAVNVLLTAMGIYLFGGNKLWSMSINGLVKYIRPRKLI